MKNQSNLIYGTVLFGGALAYVLLVFLPNQTAIADLKTQIKVKQDFFLQTEKLKQDIEQAQQLFIKAQDYNQRCFPSALEKSQHAPLLEEITVCVKQAGATILRFDPQEAEKMETLQKISILLECKGSFAEIFRLVQNLERLSTFIWIENLTIQAKENNNQDLLFQVALEVFTDNQEISD